MDETLSQQAAVPWLQPGWMEDVTAWIMARLGEVGLLPTGPIEQPHIRPWSTVLRVPTTLGLVYFKATAPVLSHEPAVTVALARWRPDCMPDMLAADTARGWMLMSDAGATLRSQVKSVADLSHWYALLPLYADLQIEMASRVPELLALGALDRRLSELPGQVERLLEDTPMLCIGEPDGLTPDQLQTLRDLMPHYAELCAELASFGLPETLHHEDFHDANIFASDGHYVFFDWGESGVAHPFFSLLVTLRSIAYRLDLADDAPELDRLRDAYLEPWARYAPHDDLVRACSLATRLAMPARALTWHRVLSVLSAEDRQEDADAVPGWLLEFLDAQARAEG
jgi:hypothetical protein